jgi:hypothetical protein
MRNEKSQMENAFIAFHAEDGPHAASANSIEN